MILDSFVEIEIKRANVRFYKEKYNCIIGDIVNIQIKDIPLGSSVVIKCKCDICDTEKQLSYRKYNKNINSYGFYSCSSKCSTSKKKKTFFNNYGVDIPTKSVFIKNKIKKTCIEKYGFDNPMKNSDVKNKSKETCNAKYNSDFFSSIYFRDKMTEKYGVNNPMESIELNEKRIKNSYKIDNFNEIKYQGKYELDFIKFCIVNNINISKPIKTIDYIDSTGKNRKYIPDFYIDHINLIIEIKSKYYYNINIENNILKEKYSLMNGYNYIIIIDKKYDNFLELYNKLTNK